MIVAIYSSSPQSGKSLVAQMFVDAGYDLVSFATPVKQSLLRVLDALGVDGSLEYLWGDKKNEIIPQVGITGGQLMSGYAMYMRSLNPDIWLNCALSKLHGNVIIDDLRFPNEYRALRQRNAALIKIVRNGVVPHNRDVTSEGQLEGLPFDYVIGNNSDISSLQRKVAEIIKEII